LITIDREQKQLFSSYLRKYNNINYEYRLYYL
jgi:hypothetical protein